MQNLQCTFYKIATCEALLINTKILSLSKKLENYASCKKKEKKIPTNQNILFPRFTSLFQISKL